jgi:hypothetical protein
MQNDPFKDFPPEIKAMLPFIIGGFCVIMLIAIIIAVFFCLSMQKALNRVSESNREMQPAMVWLLLVPCFNYVWMFFIASKVPASLQKEFRDRDQDDGSDYGAMLGLVTAICVVVTAVLSFVPFISICSLVTALVYLVTGIMFWVKIAGYSGQLGESPRRKSTDTNFTE